jgi:hypothetical protein
MEDKIIRVSMPFDGASVSRRIPGSDLIGKARSGDRGIDPLELVPRVRSWIAKRGKGVFKSNKEIARSEGITPARVSQLLPIGKMTDEQVHLLKALSDLEKLSIRKLIQIAKNPRAEVCAKMGGESAVG